jgi:hypothetical protein
MASNLLRRAKRFLERIAIGEIPLITDDRWLPNPIDVPSPDRHPTAVRPSHLLSTIRR